MKLITTMTITSEEQKMLKNVMKFFNHLENEMSQSKIIFPNNYSIDDDDCGTICDICDTILTVCEIEDGPKDCPYGKDRAIVCPTCLNKTHCPKYNRIV